MIYVNITKLNTTSILSLCYRTCRRLSSGTSDSLIPDNRDRHNHHPLSMQTRRKTIYQRPDNSPESPPRSEQLPHRHLEVNPEQLRTTPSPQKRASNSNIQCEYLTVWQQGEASIASNSEAADHQVVKKGRGISYESTPPALPPRRNPAKDDKPSAPNTGKKCASLHR